MPGILVTLVLGGVVLGGGDPLPGSGALTGEGDVAARMVEGIGLFLDRELGASAGARAARWQRDLASREAYAASVEPNRGRFRRIIGAADVREPARLEVISGPSGPAWLAEEGTYRVLPVRWAALKGVDAEGLLLEPEGKTLANVVALPDCDWTPEALVGLQETLPESSEFARRLAASGCRVLVPLLMDRRDTHSGNPAIRMTNQPHREYIYRAAYEMGRHIIGIEVQKVLAAVDWFSRGESSLPIGVIGYGEGGLLALYAAAADTRIAAALVSGYFGPRESIWREPIYRNVWGLLQRFGDAEIAAMVAPRALVIEASPEPAIDGPPPPSKGRAGAAPGAIATPDPGAVEGEFRRALSMFQGLDPAPAFSFFRAGEPIGDGAMRAFLRGLGAGTGVGTGRGTVRAAGPGLAVHLSGAESRFKRQFDQLVDYGQRLMREGEFRRAAFWAKADDKDAAKWAASSGWYREYFRDEVIGRLVPPTSPPDAKSRLIFDEPNFAGYEYTIGIHPDVFASGILLVPKGIGPGERRPVVVCQHGLEGRPRDCADPRVDHRAYHRFACALADRGFVACAPQNPYVGGDAFRVLQRKANPLGQSLFSFIVQQHEQLLEWLAGQPFVDPARIGFYGLSYGGKTAMRVPALVEGYCLSICSGDFNEWIWKNCSVDHRYSYLFTGEYEMPEFDLGNTFNYAEMSWLICPRPFMVERGRRDGVAPDEWVAYEFAKTGRRYELLGIGDRARIEYFDGPHTIHGQGTFEFLHRHLNWPPGR